MYGVASSLTASPSVSVPNNPTLISLKAPSDLLSSIAIRCHPKDMRKTLETGLQHTSSQLNDWEAAGMTVCAFGDRAESY